MKAKPPSAAISSPEFLLFTGRRVPAQNKRDYALGAEPEGFSQMLKHLGMIASIILRLLEHPQQVEANKRGRRAASKIGDVSVLEHLVFSLVQLLNLSLGRLPIRRGYAGIMRRVGIIRILVHECSCRSRAVV